APIRLLAPHRSEFRLRLYPHLPLTGFRLGFAFPVARPFVCECRTIPAIPSRWTIPGLPESLTLFPTVSPANTLVRRSGTQCLRPHNAGSTLLRLWPTGSSVGIAPVDYDPVVLLKPFGPHLAAGRLPPPQTAQ